MYSLSTCWNSHRHTDGRAMLREIRELGFDYAELSHGIRISLLPGILDAVDAGEWAWTIRRPTSSNLRLTTRASAKMPLNTRSKPSRRRSG